MVYTLQTNKWESLNLADLYFIVGSICIKKDINAPAILLFQEKEPGADIVLVQSSDKNKKVLWLSDHLDLDQATKCIIDAIQNDYSDIITYTQDNLKWYP